MIIECKTPFSLFLWIAVGFLYKYINRQLTIIVLTLLFSIVVILLPYSQELWHLYLCTFVTGIGYGVYFNTNNVWLLELFGDKSGPILQVTVWS